MLLLSCIVLVWGWPVWLLWLLWDCLDFAFSGELHVSVYHHVYEGLKGCFAWVPAECCACLGGVSEELFDFGGAEEARVDFDECASGVGVYAFFVEAGAFPSQVDACAGEGAKCLDIVILGMMKWLNLDM